MLTLVMRRARCAALLDPSFKLGYSSYIGTNGLLYVDNSTSVLFSFNKELYAKPS